jgi:hypothetical protein
MPLWETGKITHAILSGWPSPTDSEVKRKVSPLPPLRLVMLPMLVVGMTSRGLCSGEEVGGKSVRGETICKRSGTRGVQLRQLSV